MSQIKTIFKKSWIIMLIIFVVITSLCFGALMLKENTDKIEGKVNLTTGNIICFDISTYNNLGGQIVAIYDYASLWKSDTMLSDFIDIIDKTDAIKVLNKNWESIDARSKKAWLSEQINVSRFSSSTMYQIVISNSVNAAEADKMAAAAAEITEQFTSYAANLSKLSDPNLKWNVVKKIDISENILTNDEAKSNEIMILLTSIIMGFFASAVYFGIVIIKNGNNAAKKQ